MSADIAEKIAEELKSPTTFDARAAVTGATYPTDSIDVYADAAVGHRVNIAANEAAQARFLAETILENLKKGDQSIEFDPTEAPEYVTADKDASELEAKLADLLKGLRGSVLTFHLRGLAPAQWRLIDAKWRKAIKPPARKNYPQTEEGEEEYTLAIYERDLLRLAEITNEMIASAIIKVVRKSDGAEDTGVWKGEDVKVINDTYLESEFNKIKSLVEQLTFANNLFQIAVEHDTDFLPKP